VITVSKDTTGVAGNGTLPVVTSSGSAVLYRTSATNLGATAAATPVLTLTRVS